MMTFDLMPLIEQAAPLITAAFGGVGVRLLDKRRSRRAKLSPDFQESAKIREELRNQIDNLHEDLEGWKAEADEWRTKYWEQVEVNISQKSELETLRSAFENLRADFDAFIAKHDNT